MQIAIPLALLFVVIAVIVYVGSNKTKSINPSSKRLSHYRLKEYIMTQSEGDFMKVLLRVVGSDYVVFPQVHLSAILDHKVRGQKWGVAFRSINGKSVDYVICDRQTFRPLIAIELDDSSHESEARKKREAQVERILEDAALPLLRVKQWRTLNMTKVRRMVYDKLADTV